MITALNFGIEPEKCIETLQGHPSYVMAITINCTGSKIVLGSKNKSEVWSLNTEECLHTLCGHKDDVECIVISHDDSKAISGSYDNSIKV